MTDFGGAIKDSRAYQLAILGVPFDEKSCFLRGAALGPAAIRAASTGKALNPYTELGVDLEHDTVLADLGDVDTSGDVDKTFLGIEASVGRILKKRAKPIILGGDHSITYPVFRALAKTYKALDILHFDAHPDLYDDLQVILACLTKRGFKRVIAVDLTRKELDIPVVKMIVPGLEVYAMDEERTGTRLHKGAT